MTLIGYGMAGGKTRRFPIPPAQPHRDRKNDHQRKPKHPHSPANLPR